ncbi:MAG: aminotransferase class V-fold PLP-dependent enzyme [Lachnospiraceae bacterium]|nr:aminotransferase class V-fold PLP-dependent enzyme [Lachnospiraceae bacterium]
MIYADNAATTKMSETAINTMISMMNETYGNPSSLYGFGQKAKEVLEEARADIAGIISV